MPGVPSQRVTPEHFAQWKMQRDQEKEQAKTVAHEQRQVDIENGKAAMTGRELYEKHPELFEGY